MAQMRACEGLIAQGRRRIATSQMRSQEISRSVEEVTLTLALPLAPSPSPSPSPSIQPTPEPNQVEEAYGEQSLEEDLSGAEVLLLIRTLTLTTPSPSPKPDPKPDPDPNPTPNPNPKPHHHQASMVESVADASFVHSAAEASAAESVPEAEVVDETSADRLSFSAGTAHHARLNPIPVPVPHLAPTLSLTLNPARSRPQQARLAT